MTELTDAQLDELERLAEAATPGKWVIRRIEGYCDNQIETDHPEFVARKPWGHVVAQVGLCAGDKDTSKFERDSEFIAAADPPTVLALVREVRRLRGACAVQNGEICEILGRELGYPWLKDDQANFPGATEDDGVCVGDHVAESLAAEAASALATARARIAELEGRSDG